MSRIDCWVVFFGTTTVVGAQSLNVLFARFIPNYMSIGGDFTIFGLDVPTMISYIILWVITVLLFRWHGYANSLR